MANSRDLYWNQRTRQHQSMKDLLNEARSERAKAVQQLFRGLGRSVMRLFRRPHRSSKAVTPN